jgi:hypothetical protein
MTLAWHRFYKARAWLNTKEGPINACEVTQFNRLEKRLGNATVKVLAHGKIGILPIDSIQSWRAAAGSDSRGMGGRVFPSLRVVSKL